MSRRNGAWSGYLSRFIAAAILNAIAVQLGFAFAFEPGSIPVFSPAAGLLLGYLLVEQRKYWIAGLFGAFVGSFASYRLADDSLGRCFGFALVQCFEAAAAALSLSSIRPQRFRLHAASDLIFLFTASGLACTIAALGMDLVEASVSNVEFWTLWRERAAADCLGVVLFAPMLLSFVDIERSEWESSLRAKVPEAVVSLVLLTAVSWGIFAIPLGGKPLLLTLPYPVFPFLLWVALRLGTAGSAIAVILAALTAVWGSRIGVGPVAVPNLHAAERVFLVQGYCIVVSLTAFLLTLAVRELRRRETEVFALNDSLRTGLTQRQAALDELRSQKQIVETVLDSMGEAVLVTDSAGKVLLENKAFRTMHLRPHYEAPSEGWARSFGLYYPDGKSLYPEDRLPLVRAARGEASDNVELLVVDAAHPNGLPISITGRPIAGPTGIEGAVIAIRNVSASRAAEAKLRESEEQYRLLVNGVRDYAIFLLDPDGSVANWNVGAERIKGYRFEEIVGKHFSCFYPPEDRASRKPERALRTALELGRYEEEGWRLRKDGSRFWANVVISAVHDAAGDLRGFAKATRDLTAKREAEQALLKSEQRFRAIFDQTFQFVGLMTSDGILLEANRTAISAAGIEERDVLGKPFWETAWWRHDLIQQERLRAAVRRAAQGETVRFEATHPAADGSTIWVDFSLKRYIAEGNAVYLIPEGRDITDRKRAEQALAQSEALLHQFVLHAPAAIAMLDVDMKYIRTSERWLADYGLIGKEIVGRSHYEVFKDLPERWIEMHRRVLAGSVERCAEDSYTRADGSNEWLQWEARPWHRPGGEIGGLMFFTQIITERKRIEVALRESENRFRAVFDASPSGLILASHLGRIVLANDFALRMFGWEREELVGQCVELLVPEQHREKHRSDRSGYFLAPISKNVGDCGDVTGLRKSGSEFPAEIGLTPIETDGELFVLAAVVDITGRKRAEESLRLGEERLRLALENARHGLWDWDVASGSVYYDELWVQIHGFEPGECDIDYKWWEASINPEDRPRVLKALNQHLASDDALYDVEYRARRKDGSWAWVNTRGRVQKRDASGRPIRMMGTIHDISERKSAENALLKSVREKEVMLREIHHRVKNNLAVISSLFHLQAGTVQDEKTTRILRDAQDRVRSMALVHEHLYNSADLGAVAFGEYSRSLAMQIFQTYQLPTTKVELVSDISAVQLSVEQAIPCGLILNELLANCLKHAFRDRERGEVRLALSSVEGFCRIRVSDDGIGVPPGLDFRVGKSLGVRLIRILTRQLDGSVQYHSSATGTEVSLWFPILLPAKV